MKIVKFIAKNFSGIYAGTGKTTIEIDFNNNLNEIILLLGTNGSGKTTLLSILHPFRETYDSRKNFILEGKDGYKEVHIKDNDDLYIIKHYYSKSSNKNKAYITKNGMELNENGGINTFMDIMKERFNLTKEYFTIGKIGSNVQGFIGKSTAERKSYINQFVPNIDEYLDAFEVVNEKWKTYNKDIKSLKASIEKIDENALSIRKVDLETNLKALEADNKELEKKITLLNKEIEDLSEKTKGIDPNIEEIVQEYLEAAELSENKLQAYINKYPKLQEYTMELIEDKINENNIKLATITEEIKNLDTSIISLKEKIEEEKLTFEKNENLIKVLKTNFEDPLEIRVNLMNKKLDLNNAKSKYEKSNKELNEINSDILGLSIPPTEIRYEIDTFFKNIDNIKSSYSLNIVETVPENNTGILYARAKENSELVERNKIELEEIKRNIYYLNTNAEKYQNTLILKPINCNNTTCSFIREASNFMTKEYPKLDEYLEKEKELETSIETSNKIIEESNTKLNFIRDIKKYLTDNFDSLLFINKLISIEDIYNVIKSSVLFQERINEIYETYSKWFNTDKLIIELTNEIERYEKIYIENTKKEKTIKQYEAENEKLSLDLITNATRVDLNENEKKSKNSSYISISNTNKLFSIVKNLVNESEKNWNAYDENNRIYKDNKQMLETIRINNIEVIKCSNKINDNNKSIILKNKEIDVIKNKLFLFETYSDKLAEIENEIQDIEIIKDALDPKKGIPLIFMNNYLNIISATANELLDKAYGGDFKIAFKVTSREFMINVFKADGTMLDDITEASQGEVSLTTIALSLAMMQNLLSNCKYNVLYLDEVDATLSTANRRVFLELLQIQLQNIDQCFVISHNDEFYSQPIDLILMKDNNLNQNDIELMENKNVLFDINRNKTA